MTDPKPEGALTRRAVLLGALVAGLAARAGRARGQVSPPEFALTARDIASVADKGGRLHIALGPAARARFAEFTGQNIGRLVRVTAGGTVVQEAVVRIEIDSGLFSSAPLDGETRRRLFLMLTGQGRP